MTPRRAASARDRVLARNEKGRPEGGLSSLPDGSDQGISTLSMTWITPFDCFTLAMVMRAVLPLLSAT